MGEAKRLPPLSISIESNVDMMALVVLEVDGAFQDLQFVPADIYQEVASRHKAALLVTGPNRYGLFKRQGGRVVDAISPVDFVNGQPRGDWEIVKLTSLKTLNGPCDLNDQENVSASYAFCSYLMSQGYTVSDGGDKAILRGNILLEIPEVWNYAKLTGRNLGKYDRILKTIFCHPQRFLMSGGQNIIEIWFSDETIIDKLQKMFSVRDMAA